MSIANLFQVLKGSSRSGNYNHAGRLGKRGGSTSLPSAVQYQLDVYSIDSTEINRALRKGRIPEEALLLDKAFIHSLPRDTIVYREVSKGVIPQGISTELGYTSTTKNEAATFGYSLVGGTEMVKIHLPKGLKVAIPSNEFGDSEIILPRNTTFMREGDEVKVFS